MKKSSKVLIILSAIASHGLVQANEVKIDKLSDIIDKNYPTFLSSCALKTENGSAFLMSNSDHIYLIEKRKGHLFGHMQMIFSENEIIYDWGLKPAANHRATIETLWEVNFIFSQNVDKLTPPTSFCEDKAVKKR